MIEKKQMKLIELLSSKLCHDLISPVGAINNGLEFMEEEITDLNREALELVRKSSSQVAQKLAYYRISLGTAGSEDFIQYEVITDLINNLFLEKNMSVTWLGINIAEAQINKFIGKLLLNLALISFDAITKNGRVEIILANDVTMPDIIISVGDKNCSLHKEIKTVLQSDASEELLTVRNILGFHCKKLAMACSKKIEIRQHTKDNILFKVT